MVERKAINAKDIPTLDIDASGQVGHWVKLPGIVDRRQCFICKATLAFNNPYTRFCSNCGARNEETRSNEDEQMDTDKRSIS